MSEWIIGIRFISVILKDVPVIKIDQLNNKNETVSSYELEEKELYQKGKTKQYHTKISEIIRRYIEKRFNFIALEQTTEEILVEIKNKIKVEEYTHLKIILERSDLAKFAKTKPTSAKNKQSMDLAKEFVEITKQKND